MVVPCTQVTVKNKKVERGQSHGGLCGGGSRGSRLGGPGSPGGREGSRRLWPVGAPPPTPREAEAATAAGEAAARGLGAVGPGAHPAVSE